ncbi:MAG: peptidase dimerization domain-containing protein [Candidatus Aminicenantes bacterium]|nr:peptidase dimerization domain-containing protein [Candidatus Aminicenantes bacterium]
MRRTCFSLFLVFSIFVILINYSSLLSAASSEKKPQVLPIESRKVAAIRKAVDAEIDALSSRLLEMNDWMYHNPEPGFLEFKASAMLTDELKKHGFVVEMGVPGLPSNFDRLKVVGGFPADYAGPPGIPTAFKAKYKGKTEHPVIGFAVEYDALRGNPPFHGCQHNMQGPTGIGAAIALAKVMEQNNIPGSVWVIGTPAEEVGPPPKAAMAKSGYLDGIDLMFRSHGTSRETLRFPGGFSARHIRQMKYTFHGKSAHAQRPWQGRSALDAVLLLFHSVDMIREHSEPQFRFHGIVSDGGVAPNIVPQMASATIWIRHLMDETPVGSMSPGKAREKIGEKVSDLDDMATAAALATKTKVDIDHYGEYNPGIAVSVLNDIVFQYAVDYGGINIGERRIPRHWEETGFATLVVPGAHVSIGTEGIPEVAGHSQENADITVSPEGHKSLILTAKVMGATALRLVMDQKLQDKARAEHKKWLEKYNK